MPSLPLSAERRQQRASFAPPLQLVAGANHFVDATKMVAGTNLRGPAPERGRLTAMPRASVKVRRDPCVHVIVGERRKPEMAGRPLHRVAGPRKTYSPEVLDFDSRRDRIARRRQVLIGRRQLGQLDFDGPRKPPLDGCLLPLVSRVAQGPGGDGGFEDVREGRWRAPARSQFNHVASQCLSHQLCASCDVKRRKELFRGFRISFRVPGKIFRAEPSKERA